MCVGARGAADPMHVILHRVRQIVVDDAPDAGDVDAARRDIGGDQDPVAAIAKALQGLAAL